MEEEKSESKIHEYDVEFIMGDKSSKQKFNTSQEIYLLYVHCSKVFQCGLISLYFNGINLNFIDKNSKLSKIFKKDTKDPIIKVLAKDNQMLKRKNNDEIIINQNYNKLNITIDKGTISQNLNEIQNNEIIDQITICDEKIEQDEIIPCFFSQIANKTINKLIINPKFLVIIDNMNNCQNLKCFNDLKELEILAEKNNVNLIKKVEYKIKNIYFPNLKRLKLKNLSIKFTQINLNILDKLDLENSYIILDSKEENKESKENNLPQLLFTSLSFLGLNYIYYTDLCQQLDIIMKRTKSVDILKLKLDSIEFNTPFNFTEFCVNNQKNIEKVKNIELNLKSKFIFDEITTKDQKKCVDKFLRKTTKLKLIPFSKFTEKELAYFDNKLSNINLLKMEMLNIEDENELIKFLQNYPDLEYISLDEKYNYLIPSKIYKLNIHSLDDIIKNKDQFRNFINNLKIDKLEKIEIPFFEFDRATKNLKILGDLLPMTDHQTKSEDENMENNNDNNQEEENIIQLTDLEEIFILLKKILFNIPYIEKLTLQNFETENKAIYLNNFLIGFMNLLSTPKINKLKLIDVYIDKGLVDKFSFIFMNSSSCLTSLELNNIKIEQDNMQFLFYNLLFQLDYKKLSTLKLANLDINQTFVQVTEEYNIFKKIDYLSLDSLNNFGLIKDIILKLDTNTGISLKNLDITEPELIQYLIDNGDYLKKIVLDLEGIKLFEVLSKDEISLKDCRTLKIYESFENFEDASKFLFLENKWLCMKKLRKLYVYIKSNSNSNKSKEKELLSLYKYVKNII
jgi:hypothetical protein